MKADVAAEVLQKLDILIALTAVTVLEDKPRGDQIESLNRAGLAPKDIAQLVGTTRNTVSVTLSKLKRAAKKISDETE